MKKITSLEYNTVLFFLIRACFIEISSSIIIASSKEDAWISILIGFLFGLMIFFLYEKMKSQYNDKDIIEINFINFKHLGFLVNFVILIGVLIFTICNFWSLVHFIDSQFLYKTSTFIVTIAVFLPICYASFKDLHILGKVSLVLFYIGMFFIIFILFGLVSGINTENIKPILHNNIFYGAFVFIAFNILPIFLLTIIPKNMIKDYSKKMNLCFYFISTFSLLNVMFLTISIFGIDLASIYNYPSFHLLKRVSVLDFIDRVESILSLEWIFALFVLIIMGLLFIKQAIFKMINFNKKTNNKIIFVICTLIAIITNFIFLTHGESDYFFTHYLIYFLYFSFLILPFISYIKGLKKS